MRRCYGLLVLKEIEAHLLSKPDCFFTWYHTVDCTCLSTFRIQCPWQTVVNCAVDTSDSISSLRTMWYVKWTATIFSCESPWVCASGPRSVCPGFSDLFTSWRANEIVDEHLHGMMEIKIFILPLRLYSCTCIKIYRPSQRECKLKKLWLLVYVGRVGV